MWLGLGGSVKYRYISLRRSRRPECIPERGPYLSVLDRARLVHARLIASTPTRIGSTSRHRQRSNLEPLTAIGSNGVAASLMSTPHIVAGHFYSIWHGSGDWERYEHPTAACPRVSKRMARTAPARRPAALLSRIRVPVRQPRGQSLHPGDARPHGRLRLRAVAP